MDELLNPKLLSKRIAEEKAEADKYDHETGTNQLERDTECYQRDIRRADMLRDQLATTRNPHDQILLADEIERIDRIIALEAERLGL